MFPSYYMTNSVKMPSSSSSAPDAPDASSSAATPVESKVDVLIIGAGPAGVMAANGLARAGVDVRIVDKRWVLFLLVFWFYGFGGCWGFRVGLVFVCCESRCVVAGKEGDECMAGRHGGKGWDSVPVSVGFTNSMIRILSRGHRPDTPSTTLIPGSNSLHDRTK